MKAYLKRTNQEITKGTILQFDDVQEPGVVVGINYELQEIYVFDGREGFTLGEQDMQAFRFE